MDDAFLVVVIVVPLVALVVALVTLASSRGAYDDLGRGGLSVEEPLPPGAGEAGLEAEIRELVELRNARRVARGEPPLDVDAEVMKALREL
jgi:hypothetical protein